MSVFNISAAIGANAPILEGEVASAVGTVVSLALGAIGVYCRDAIANAGKSLINRLCVPLNPTLLADIRTHLDDYRKCAWRIPGLERLSENSSPEALCRALQRLKVSDANRLDFSILELQTLPEQLCSILATKFPQLTELTLAGNQLETLPQSINQFSQLKDLQLGWNRLEELPDSLSSLSYLESLSINDNRLVRLPANFSALSALKDLDLKNNRLRELPVNFGAFSMLRSLNLNNNALTRLPDSFVNLSTLEGVAIMHNRLTELPANFERLRALRDLSLSHNALRHLPEGFANLPSLGYLFLNNNDLQQLPAGLDPRRLTMIDTSGNPGLIHGPGAVAHVQVAPPILPVLPPALPPVGAMNPRRSSVNPFTGFARRAGNPLSTRRVCPGTKD